MKLKKILGNIRYYLLSFTIITALIFAIADCNSNSSSGGPGDNGNNNGDGSPETGILSIGLTDVPSDSYDAVYVTIAQVSVHRGDTDEDEWDVVATPNQTYNLLELVDGVVEKLGSVELDAGSYTQIRLLLGETPDDALNILDEEHPAANYVVYKNAEQSDEFEDKYHILKVPSGYQSGIKLVNEFDIQAGTTTELILDFDASRSIVVAGKSDKLILKPTIKVIGLNESKTTGRVVNEEGEGLPGVHVTAQVYNPDAEDPKDRIEVINRTSTDELGFFSMFLEVGTYYLIAYSDYQSEGPNYLPVCQTVNVELIDDTVEQEIILASAEGQEFITISGTVSITDVDDTMEQAITLSFRQTSDCAPEDSESEEIEIKPLNVADGESYSIMLPPGTYTVVASTDNHTTQEDTVNSTATLDLTFPE